MFRSIKTSLFVVVSLSLLAVGAFAQLPLPSQAIADSLQKILDKARTTESTNGAVLAVMKPGEWSWSGASGKSSVNPDTIAVPGMTFRLASISKTFCMAVTLQLAEEGKLSLSDTITKFLRLTLVDTIPNGRNMTVKQLLQHTSGVGNYTANSSFSSVWNSNPSKVWAPEELVWYGAQRGASFLPGKGWSYSNTGFVLLAMIAESVSGKSYEENIQTRIIDFLGLKHTYYPPGTNIPESHMVSSDHHGSTFIGAGEMISNADDLNLFHEAVYQKKFFGQNWIDSINTFVGAQPPYWYYSLGYMKYNYSQAIVTGHGGNLPLTSSGMYYNAQCNFYMAFDFNKSNLNGLSSLIFPVKAYMCSLLTGKPEDQDAVEVILPIRIYPNPSAGEFQVAINEVTGDGLILAITDISGRIVHKEILNVDSSWFLKNYSLPELPAGLYSVTVSGDKTHAAGRIMIVK